MDITENEDLLLNPICLKQSISRTYGILSSNCTSALPELKGVREKDIGQTIEKNDWPGLCDNLYPTFISLGKLVQRGIAQECDRAEDHPRARAPIVRPGARANCQARNGGSVSRERGRGGMPCPLHHRELRLCSEDVDLCTDMPCLLLPSSSTCPVSTTEIVFELSVYLEIFLP